MNITLDDYWYDYDETLTLLQYCSTVGINVPRFCYHEKLSIAGNCRMCLLEEDLGEKLLASCAIEPEEEMQFYTQTYAVKKAREGILEFLLINHPLDCPICDQGGECDLQDQTVVFGSDRGRFYENKRAVTDKDFGPLIKTVMNRCIHCTRCVRFLSEVAGFGDLGIIGRGGSMEIGTFVEKYIHSELSGNITDICPVGALTSKPYAFLSRPWELNSIHTIDIFDSLNSSIRIDIRGVNVLRILPRLNNYINEDWITDKIRYSYDAIKLQRLLSPLLKLSTYRYLVVSGKRIIAVLKNNLIAMVVSLLILKKKYLYGQFYLGDFLNYQSVVASLYMARSLGSPYIYRKMSSGLLDRNFFKISEECANVSQVMLIGVNLRFENPILNLRLRREVEEDNTLVYSVGNNVNLNFFSKHLGSLAELLQIFKGKHGFSAQLFNPTTVFVGQTAFTGFNKGKPLIDNLIKYVDCDLKLVMRRSVDMALNDIGYSQCVHDQNVSFNRHGVHYLIGFDDYRFMQRCSSMVIYQGHHNDVNASSANIILPVKTFFESAGSFMNIFGYLQRSNSILLFDMAKKLYNDVTVIEFLLKRLFNISKKDGLQLGLRVAPLSEYSCNGISNSIDGFVLIENDCDTFGIYCANDSISRNSNIMGVASKNYLSIKGWDGC